MKNLLTLILFFITINLYSQIPNITVLQSNNPSPGKLFMGNVRFGPQFDPLYLLIVNNDGSVYWSRQMAAPTWDFKKQPNGTLTFLSAALGIGNLNVNRAFYSLDSNYNIIDSFRVVSPPDDTFWTDNHECIVFPNGHALILGLDYSRYDMSVIVQGGNPNANIEGYVIQEIDQNNNVLFEWNTFDHFLIQDAIGIDLTADYIDPWHVNAIEKDRDGNILISTRHLNEITKINRKTGEIMWRLGGPQNQFKFPNDSIEFSYQHDIRRLPNGNITLFDNGNFRSPPNHFSRAVEYQLNEVTKVATKVWEYRHAPDIYGFAMGSVQRLPNGNTLISWGSSTPTITEITPSGQVALEMTFPPDVYTYRTYKGDWPTSPALQTLNLTAIIEGFYNASIDRMIEDTARVYLRNSTSPYAAVDSAKAFLDSSGTAVFSFSNALNEVNYYIQLKHRNSIETWSAAAISFTNSLLAYDFTTDSGQAYGNNMIQIDASPLRFALYSGDVNGDGFVNLNDIILTSNNAINFINGYINTDLNGDNVTNLSDILIVYNNSNGFVSKSTPQ